MTTKKAIVTKKVSHYGLNNISYVPGDVVEVSDHLYERGCSIGHLKPVPKPEPKVVEEIPSKEPEGEGETITAPEKGSDEKPPKKDEKKRRFKP